MAGPIFFHERNLPWALLGTLRAAAEKRPVQRDARLATRHWQHVLVTWLQGTWFAHEFSRGKVTRTSVWRTIPEKVAENTIADLSHYQILSTNLVTSN